MKRFLYWLIDILVRLAAMLDRSLRASWLILLALPALAQPAGWGIPATEGIPMSVTLPARVSATPDCVPRAGRPCPEPPVSSQTVSIVLVRGGVAITTLELASAVASNVAKVFTVSDNRIRSGDWIVVESNPSMIRAEECSTTAPNGLVHSVCRCYDCRGPILNGQRPTSQWFRNMR